MSCDCCCDEAIESFIFVIVVVEVREQDVVSCFDVLDLPVDLLFQTFQFLRVWSVPIMIVARLINFVNMPRCQVVDLSSLAASMLDNLVLQAMHCSSLIFEYIDIVVSSVVLCFLLFRLSTSSLRISSGNCCGRSNLMPSNI